MKTVTIDDLTFEIETVGNDILLMSFVKDIWIDGGHRELERQAEKQVAHYVDFGDGLELDSLDGDAIRDFVDQNIVEYCKNHAKDGIITNH